MGTRRATSRPRRGLTLVELLVAVTIIALLMSILLTALSGVRGAAQAVICKNKLQIVGQEFQLFADDYSRLDRGDSEQFGPGRFRLEDFQDRLYGTEEFTDPALPPFGMTELKSATVPLVCPSGPRPLRKRNTPDPAVDALAPLAHVSVGFNMRLHRASVTLTIGTRTLDVLRPVTLTARALDHPWTPLAFDVDGQAAVADGSGRVPFFSAPALDSTGLFADDRFWFPSLRHQGMMHAVFLGGHVWSSADPVRAAGWQWGYQPPSDE